MGGAVAQLSNRNIYERTKDLKRMLTSAQLTEAIIKEVRRTFAEQQLETNIFDVLPARVATSMEYKSGARRALVWNEGESRETIDLPLENGWRESDGNPYGVPNGRPSTRDNPDAFYLSRLPNDSFSGPAAFSNVWKDGYGRRHFYACDNWSSNSGVALVGSVSSVLSSAMVLVPKEKLASVADPQQLRQDAAQLRQLAENLQERFKGQGEVLTQIVNPLFEKAARFIEVAEAIEQARK